MKAVEMYRRPPTKRNLPPFAFRLSFNCKMATIRGYRWLCQFEDMIACYGLRSALQYCVCCSFRTRGTDACYMSGPQQSSVCRPAGPATEDEAPWVPSGGQCVCSLWVRVASPSAFASTTLPNKVLLFSNEIPAL
jgi:hypothetical protein